MLIDVNVPIPVAVFALRQKRGGDFFIDAAFAKRSAKSALISD